MTCFVYNVLLFFVCIKVHVVLRRGPQGRLDIVQLSLLKIKSLLLSLLLLLSQIGFIPKRPDITEIVYWGLNQSSTTSTI